MESVLKFFSFGPFGRAIALAAGASASTPNPLGFGIAWRGRSGGYDPCRRQTVQKKMKEGGASVRRSVSRPRRTRHGGAWSTVEIVPKRQRRIRLPPAPWRRAGRSATVRSPCGPSSFSSCAAWSGTSRASTPCALRAPRHRRRAGCPLRRCSPRTVRRTME